MNWNKSLFLLLTDDEALKDTLGPKLKEWGADILYLRIGDLPFTSNKAIEIVLIDVRRKATEALQHFKTVKGGMPFAEALIVNRSGNIGVSMEGMRAGAGDELLVPFDTETLREKIDAALERSRTKQKKEPKRSIFSVFSDTMSAVTFAQAGEFETALGMLDGSNSGAKEKSKTARKVSVKVMNNSNREKEQK